MNLAKKRLLATRVLGVGKERIKFDSGRLDEIKEAITSEDIRELARNGAIRVAEISGRTGKKNEKTKRHDGKIRQKVNKRKREYMFLVRKLRKQVAVLKKQKKINVEAYKHLRVKIKARVFKNKTQMMEAIKNEISTEKKKKGE